MIESNIEFIVELEEAICDKMKTISAVKNASNGYAILTHTQIKAIVDLEHEIEKLETLITRLER